MLHSSSVSCSSQENLFCRKKTVVVSLWNEHATNLGQELLDIAEKSPIVAIKSLKVGDFQGTNYFLSLK